MNLKEIFTTHGKKGLFNGLTVAVNHNIERIKMLIICALPKRVLEIVSRPWIERLFFFFKEFFVLLRCVFFRNISHIFLPYPLALCPKA